MLFLIALMGALMLTNLGPLPIAGVMLAGWLIAAGFEWAASRNEAHFGSGLPPRYYVPQVSLPPARPLEQVGAGYPEQRDEAPTWIASAAMREELLGEWPVASYTEDPLPADAEQEAVSAAASTPVSEAVADAAPAPPEPDPEAQPDVPAPVAAELQPPAADSDAESSGPSDEPDTDEDALAGVAEATGLEPDTAAPRRRRFWQRDVAEDADPWQVEELPLKADAAVDPTPAAASPAPEEVAFVAAAPGGSARYSLDPLVERERGRRSWQRGSDPDVPSIEVPARPPGLRALPQHATAVRVDGED